MEVCQTRVHKSLIYIGNLGRHSVSLFDRIPFAEKRPRRPETGIKDAISQMEHEFQFPKFRKEKRTTFSDVPLLTEIFRWNDPKSAVPFTF